MEVVVGDFCTVFGCVRVVNCSTNCLRKIQRTRSTKALGMRRFAWLQSLNAFFPPSLGNRMRTVLLFFNWAKEWITSGLTIWGPNQNIDILMVLWTYNNLQIWGFRDSSATVWWPVYVIQWLERINILALVTSKKGCSLQADAELKQRSRWYYSCWAFYLLPVYVKSSVHLATWCCHIFAV